MGGYNIKWHRFQGPDKAAGALSEKISSILDSAIKERGRTTLVVYCRWD